MVVAAAARQELSITPVRLSINASTRSGTFTIKNLSDRDIQAIAGLMIKVTVKGAAVLK